VSAITSTRIKKGDRVLVLTGKDRGKQGKVLKRFAKDERVVVEGVNMVKRHTKPSQKTPQGGIVNREAPLHVSNVAVICSACEKPTRIGVRVDEKGAKLRVCRKCGADMD
jgi:large subunit ribosomal protein L24